MNLSDSLIAGRRSPSYPGGGRLVRGGRFTATSPNRSGLPVGSTSVLGLRATPPRSTPTTASGLAGARTVRWTSTVNATNQRPASARTVADKIRARPSAIRRASFRVDSCVLIEPNRGNLTCRRSSSRRIVPVVNRVDGVCLRRDLNPWKPTRRPLRTHPWPPRAPAAAAAARARWPANCQTASGRRGPASGPASLTTRRFSSAHRCAQPTPKATHDHDKR
jgi:hypothetical protein